MTSADHLIARPCYAHDDATPNANATLMSALLKLGLAAGIPSQGRRAARLFDSFSGLAFPIFLLAIVIMVVLEPSTTNVVVALGIVRIPIYARVVRGSVLSVKENEYIEAVRALALSHWRVLFHHVLPNCMAPIIITSTLSVSTSILIESSLSFLGLGTQPPTPSWGWDLKANLVFIDTNPWIVVFPGLAIFLTTLAFNMLGDGLRDALDPRLKR